MTPDQAINSDPSDHSAHKTGAIWQEIAPILDTSPTNLGVKVRNALPLGFFDQNNLAEVGHALGIGEDGARKRAERALEKLRGLLVQRGLAVPTALLATVFVANAAFLLSALTVSTALTGTVVTTPLMKGV